MLRTFLDFIAEENIWAFTACWVVLSCLVVPWWIRRRKRKAFKSSETKGSTSERLVEDPDALAAAEVKANQMNLRDDLAERGFVRVGEYSSLHGFSVNYMEELVQHLQKDSVSAVYETVNSGPMGFGASITEPMSVHYLYCHQDNLSRVQEILEKHFSKG